jgi:septal ring factor EnvC (AmiA/AmiB activator)
VRAAALALAAALAASSVAGADPAALLREAERALSAARAPRERLSALGAASAAQEAALAALRDDLRRLAVRRATLAQGLAAGDGRAFAALEALDRLARAPPAAHLAHPGGPVAAARASAALAEALPTLRREADGARAALAELGALAAEREALTATLRAALAGLQTTRAEIAGLLEKGAATPLPPDLAAAVASGAARMRAVADSLNAALAALAPGEAPASAEAFAAARGRLPPPVAGRILRRFGAPGPNGPSAGIEIAAPAWALVRAPWLSTLRYAGAVGELGTVAILEPAPGALIVLAGLAGVDRAVGETLMPGEPVGALGGPPPDAEEFLVEASQGQESPPAEIVYIELRLNGEPTDPEPWFAPPEQRPNG